MINGRPYCDHMGSMAGQQDAAASGVSYCSHSSMEDAFSAAHALAGVTRARVAIGLGDCPAVAEDAA